MPPKVILYMLKELNEGEKTRFQFVFQCAPFLKGIKAASLFWMEGYSLKELEYIIRNTDILCRELAVRKGKYMVLFYRDKELLRIIRDDKVWAYLQSYGYEERILSEVLNRLAERMHCYVRQEIMFPHEIGVFLDYPLEDVKAFAQNRGKNSLFTGYWKVYANAPRAKFTFMSYDKAKLSAVNEFLAGKSVDEIAKSVREI